MIKNIELESSKRGGARERKTNMLHTKHYRVGHIANQPKSKGHIHDYYKGNYTQTTLKFYH